MREIRIATTNMVDRDSFDALGYLRARYQDSRDQRVIYQLGKLHTLFKENFPQNDDLKVLDFGSGPVIQHSISAASKASEIVFCDIFPSNREAVQKWLKKDANAFNWSPHFDYVVKTLEGKGGKEARQREERIRQIAKVVYCDAQAEQLIEKGYEGPYDIVLEFACLMAACTDKQNYRSCMKSLTSLLKPGGVFVHYSSNSNCSPDDGELLRYPVGDKDFPYIGINHEYVTALLKEDGFADVCSDFVPLDPHTSSQYLPKRNGFHFITAKKNTDNFNTL